LIRADESIKNVALSYELREIFASGERGKVLVKSVTSSPNRHSIIARSPGTPSTAGFEVSYLA
jgi:hypothetical protein